MVATGINKEGVSLYVTSSPFKCHFGALMWLHGTRNSLGHLQERISQSMLNTSSSTCSIRFTRFSYCPAIHLHEAVQCLQLFTVQRSVELSPPVRISTAWCTTVLSSMPTYLCFRGLTFLMHGSSVSPYAVASQVSTSESCVARPNCSSTAFVSAVAPRFRLP